MDFQFCMADGRKNNGGPRPNSGNPGRGSLRKVLDNVKANQDIWWTTWAEMMKTKEERRYAMTEFNKMQTKLMPTKMEDDEGNAMAPVMVTFLNKPDVKEE